jgi:serine/threonine-protein kinase
MAASPEPAVSSSTQAWERREEFIRRFEAAWQQGGRPAIEDYLPPTAADRHAVLVELVHAELEYRLQAGEPARVEDYLRRYPDLDQPAVALDLIATEFARRRRRESGLSAEEYVRRFPAYRDELRARLAAVPPGPEPRPDTPPLDAAATSPPAAPGAAPNPAGEAPPAQAGRYLLEGEIAAGGMGRVYRAYDPELGRSLAVKVLLERHRDLPELEKRFRAEAQITGQLQHPGIPPVHEVGTLADGRPFLAMKLIQGRTLADLLKERATLAEDLPRWLGVFEQVCQALAYAHSRGILHRDLKPSNVMVGAFGEVQVMDWGLAKVLRPAAPAEANGPPGLADVVRTLRTAAGEPGSQIGAVLGTPAYMPPEQARGEVEALDERADVFGLGAILCEVLTGQPPYVARDSWEIMLLAAQGDLADAQHRLEASGAEAELQGLARRCLAATPAERPPDAGAVAQALSGYLAALQLRVREAELAREKAQVLAAEERKRRRLRAALGALALVLVLLGGIGAWWWDRQENERQAREKETRQAVRAAVSQLPDWIRKFRFAEAAKLLEQAESRLGTEGAEDLRALLEQAQKDLGMAKKLDAIRLDKATLVAGKLGTKWAAPRYAAAFQVYGLDVGADPVAKLARRIAGAPIKEQLVAALDDWAWGAKTRRTARRLLAIARGADPDVGRDQLRTLVVRRSKQKLQELVARAKVTRLSPALLLILGKLLQAHRGDGVGLLRLGLDQHPDDFWLNFYLAYLLSQKGKARLAESAGYYRAALAVRPGTPAVLYNLGLVLKAQGKLAEAVQAYRRAIALNPTFALAHDNLGVALYAQGKLATAAKAHRRALALNPRLADAHANLGVVLCAQKKFAAAEKEFRRALALNPKQVAAHNNLGLALRAQGKLAEAIKELRRAVELVPGDARGHNNLGVALDALGRLSEAKREYRRAIALDPKFAEAYYNLGNALIKQGRLAAAGRAFRTVRTTDPRFARGHHTLGLALVKRGRLAAAEKEFQRATELDPKHAQARYFFGYILMSQRRLAEAERELRRAVQLDPKEGKAHGLLGMVLLHQGRFAQARRALGRGLRLLPDNSRYRPLFTRLLGQCRRSLALDRKLTAILKGEAQPAGAAELLQLAFLCQQYKKHYATAVRFYAAAFTSDSRLAADLHNQNRYHAACAAALAAAGKGSDPDQLDAKEKARLRGQALTWLKADLALRAKQVQSDNPPDRQAAQETLKHWQQDPDLAGVRERAALAQLPETERRGWAKFWAEVDALRKKVSSR